MTYKEANTLRRRILAENAHCIVPRGYGPDGFFCRIFRAHPEVVDFYCPEQWDAYRDARDERRQRLLDEMEGIRRPRSPIEALIDQACGITRYKP